MKHAVMLLVTVATISWSAAPTVDHPPDGPPMATTHIPYGSMVGWAISKWDRPGIEVAGGLIALETIRRGAIIGSEVGGLLGGIAGALFGGALGGF